MHLARAVDEQPDRALAALRRRRRASRASRSAGGQPEARAQIDDRHDPAAHLHEPGDVRRRAPGTGVAP